MITFLSPNNYIMKSIWAILFFLSLNIGLNGQLITGSQFTEDIIGTDVITNEEVNVQQWLSEGKIVIIDVFATWCGPCWGFHTSGVLEELYEEHGPEGSDKIRILGIEADSLTTLTDLYEDTFLSFGNWTINQETGENLEYNIIDSYESNAILNINYYPTLYIIYPDQEIIEVGSFSPDPRFIEEFWLSSIGELDAPFTSLGTDVQSDIFCDSHYVPQQEATITNTNNYPIESGKLSVVVNNVEMQTIEIGEIAPYMEKVILIDSFLISEESEVSVSVSEVNGLQGIGEPISATFSQLPIISIIDKDFENDSIQIIEGMSHDVPTWASVLNAEVLEKNAPVGGYTDSEQSLVVNFWQWSNSPNSGNPLDASIIFLSQLEVSDQTSLLNFDYAYTTWDGSNDVLSIEVSTDCGDSWTSLWSKSGSDLATAPEINSDNTWWVPDTSDDWASAGVSLEDYIGQVIRIRLFLTSDWGDNLYIDNIRTQVLSAVDDLEDAIGLSIYPNPTSDLLNVELNLETSLPVTLSLFNQMGQLVAQKIRPLTQSGRQIMTIDTDYINSGVYNLKINIGENDLDQKVVIIK